MDLEHKAPPRVFRNRNKILRDTSVRILGQKSSKTTDPALLHGTSVSFQFFFEVVFSVAEDIRILKLLSGVSFDHRFNLIQVGSTLTFIFVENWKRLAQIKIGESSYLTI